MIRLHSVINALFLISLMGCCLGCSNELNLHGSGEAIPIVYCLLNPLEETQYVRVGKTFLQSDESLDSELSLDSIIWPIEAEIYIERWTKSDPVETIIFERDYAIEKDSGLFPIGGLQVYRSDFKPNPGEEYHLYVYFDEIDKIVSGRTIILDIPIVIDPENVPGRTVSFDTISPYNIRWTAGSQAGLYQGIFKMNYSESLSADFSLQNCIFKTPLYYKLKPEDIYEEKVNGFNFLQSVGKQVSPVKGAIRELINFEFYFYAVGPEVAILVSSEMGLSNPFTLVRNSSNIAGGVGVFSSASLQKLPNLKPSLTTKYFLATSVYTKHLGFKKE